MVKDVGGETNQSELQKAERLASRPKDDPVLLLIFLQPGRIQLNLQGKECIKLFNTVLINFLRHEEALNGQKLTTRQHVIYGLCLSSRQIDVTKPRDIYNIVLYYTFDGAGGTTVEHWTTFRIT